MWHDDGHGVRMHDVYGAGWTLMLILVALLAIAVAVLVAVVLRPTHPAPPVTTTPPGRPPESEAQQILRLGNTATHLPQGLGGLPGMTAMATHQMRKTIAELGIPDVPEFLQQIVDPGGHLWACRMSADIQRLSEEDLYDEVEGIISASDFIEKTEGAQLLFI
jgi:peroxiredoxin family protein